ncbi:MAG: hypothetical protein EKK52_00995 [Burkholderiales bacterium]|uniref:hypothetical protein n=1 Tax=Roseateles sp. TaxID=1971397 RepID=UPI000F9D72C9|nr:MAG: hypothetical protein EKK52_00995 [Burkholderiales bacterium]
MRKNRLLLTLITLALAACAEAPVQTQVAEAKTNDTTCVLETPTGTTIPKKLCRTEAQRAADKEAVKEFDNLRRTNASDGRAGR